jgi:hypothetical protein
VVTNGAGSNASGQGD